MVIATAVCLILAIGWGISSRDRRLNLLVKYSSDTAELLCEHFGWNSEAFCTQANMQNARVLNLLLDWTFPSRASNYYDLEPYIAMLPSSVYLCNGDSEYERLIIGNCPPPEECKMADTSYYGCTIQLPGQAGDMLVNFGIRTGRIISIGVGEYPEST